MGGINAMTQYQEYFGYKEVGASTGIGEYSLYHLLPYRHLSYRTLTSLPYLRCRSMCGCLLRWPGQ